MEKFLQNSLRGLSFTNKTSLPDKKKSIVADFSENIFNKKEQDKNFETQSENVATKRLNDFDSNILSKKNASFGAFNIKNVQNEIKSAENLLEEYDKEGGFLKTVFPKIYNRRLLKSILERIKSLNSTELSLKQIPFGEQDIRYKELVDYLSEINSLQTKLNKKIQK